MTFIRNDQCEQAFQSVKQALASSSVLIPPNFYGEYFVRVNASEEGFDDDGTSHPMAYASRAINDAEKSIL